MLHESMLPPTSLVPQLPILNQVIKLINSPVDFQIKFPPLIHCNCTDPFVALRPLSLGRTYRSTLSSAFTVVIVVLPVDWKYMSNTI